MCCNYYSLSNQKVDSQSQFQNYVPKSTMVNFIFISYDPFVRFDNQHVVIFAILPSLKWTIFLYFMNRYFMSHDCSFESYRPPIVQILDSANHQINHYPIDKY